MMMKKSKSSFFISTDSEPDTDSDSDYEQGDCFDLDNEWRPIYRVPKKNICDKIRITHYILFFTIITLFGYILYRTMTDLYTDG